MHVGIETPRAIGEPTLFSEPRRQELTGSPPNRAFSAPAASSVSTTSAWPFFAAHISGVRPQQGGASARGSGSRPLLFFYLQLRWATAGRVCAARRHIFRGPGRCCSWPPVAPHTQHSTAARLRAAAESTNNSQNTINWRLIASSATNTPAWHTELSRHAPRPPRCATRGGGPKCTVCPCRLCQATALLLGTWCWDWSHKKLTQSCRRADARATGIPPNRAFSAPAARSAPTTSAWPVYAAKISGVPPQKGGLRRGLELSSKTHEAKGQQKCFGTGSFWGHRSFWGPIWGARPRPRGLRGCCMLYF